MHAFLTNFSDSADCLSTDLEGESDGSMVMVNESVDEWEDLGRRRGKLGELGEGGAKSWGGDNSGEGGKRGESGDKVGEGGENAGDDFTYEPMNSIILGCQTT